MSGNQTHAAEVRDLASRLTQPAGWFGVVADPTHPAAVPIILSDWFGPIDSLTWARHAVQSQRAAGRRFNMTLEEQFAEPCAYDDDDDEYWDVISDPLAHNPTPQLLAVAVVALQRLGIEVGREAIAHGLNPIKAPPSGIPSGPRPTVAALWDWVTNRWTTEPTSDDLDLRPDRVLNLVLREDVDLGTVLALALRVARIAFAGRDTADHIYVALQPELSPPNDDHEGETEHGTDPNPPQRCHPSPAGVSRCDEAPF